MRRLTTALTLVLIATLLSGCIIIPDRHYYRGGYEGGGYYGRGR